MRRIATFALALAALGTACGGGSSDGGTLGAGGGSQAPVSAGFTADEPQPGNATVAMAESSRSGDVVTVRIDVRAADVFGGAFDVTYDASNADFVGWSAGSLLEQGGNAPNYTVALSQNGTVVVGASRTGATGVAGTGQSIVNLSFRVRRSGTFPVAFQNATLYGDQNPPQPIGGVVWHAGSLTGA
jgi:hypothetical protein